MNIAKLNLIFINIALASVILSGCEKKEPSQKIPEKIMKSTIEKKDINKNIIDSFPTVFDYIYPSGKILSQEGEKIDRDYSTPKDTPEYKSSLIMIESTDSIEEIHEFYKKLFPQENIRISEKNGSLNSIFCFLISKTGGTNNTSVEIQLKVTQPYKNFSGDVLQSQIDTINTQISQYEKILEAQIQRKQETDNDSPSLPMINNAITHCKTQIDKLQSQVSFLNNKSAVIELKLTYLNISLKKPAQ